LSGGIEPAWAAPEKVVAGGDSTCPPFGFLNADGGPAGISVDIGRVWGKKTGIAVEYRLMEWSEALSQVRQGTADILGGIFPGQDRDLFFDFSMPCHQINTRIFHHENIVGINSLADLSGFTIGVVKDDFAESRVRHNLPTAQVLSYPSNEALVQAALAGAIRVFVADGPTAPYYLSRQTRNGQPKFHKSKRPVYTSPLAGAVQEGNAGLLALVNKGMRDISPKEKNAIFSRRAEAGADNASPRKAAALGVGALIIILCLAVYSLRLRKRARALAGDFEAQTAALARAGQKKDAILASLDRLILEVDENGIFQNIVPTRYTHRFLDLTNLLGKSLRDVFSEEEADDCLRRVREVLKTGQPQTKEIEIEPEELVLDCAISPLTESTVTLAAADVTGLKESERKYREIIEGANCVVMRLDTQGNILFFNEYAERFFGYRRDEIIGKNVLGAIIPNLDKPENGFEDYFYNLPDHPEGFTRAESENMRKNGERVWVEWSNRPILSGGEAAGILCIGNDITGTKKAQAELREKERYYSALIEKSSDIITIIDDKGAIRFMSQSVKKLSDHDPSDFAGQNLYTFVHEEDVTQLREVIHSVLDNPGDTPILDFRCSFYTAQYRRMEACITNLLHDPAVRGIIIHNRDVTDQKDIEEQLRIQAFFDPLTGLPNKALLIDRLQHTMERASRKPGYKYAILFIDLDRFKLINESLGHSAGDKVLQSIARRLSRQVRKADTVARYLGDKFVLLLEDVDDRRHVIRLVERIQKDISPPVQVGDHEVFVSAGIGIVYGSPEYQSPHHIIRDAETAMYRGKAAGKKPNKSKCEIFHSGMHEETVELLRLETDLRRAVDRKEFVLHYQPILDLNTYHIVGMEALIRWPHPERGMISPLDFIPLAEEMGLIVPIGTWVMRESCLAASEYVRAMPKDMPFLLGLNISVIQLLHGDFLNETRKILRESDLDPSRIKFEITESVMMDASDEILPVLRELKKFGVRLALDDFGTGYSSLSYLHHFPFDTLKIDRSFVSQMGLNGDRHTKIVQTIMSLAQHLDMSVIAEGIETEYQVKRLKGLRCPYGQGFLFSRPMKLDQFKQFHQNNPHGLKHLKEKMGEEEILPGPSPEPPK
jgi:diguanylate cyclase (GGDEF)-like protein/PAS domain S-box-containing protein